MVTYGNGFSIDSFNNWVQLSPYQYSLEKTNIDGSALQLQYIPRYTETKILLLIQNVMSFVVISFLYILYKTVDFMTFENVPSTMSDV